MKNSKPNPRKGRVMGRLEIDVVAGRVDRHMQDGSVRINIGTPDGLGYRQISFGGKTIRIHRLVYMHVHGPVAPWMEIDHIHGKEAGDGIGNLRWVNRFGQTQNLRSAKANNKTGFLGVKKHPKYERFNASIRVNGVVKNLGWFGTPEEASKCYLDAKRTMHTTCSI